MYSRDSNDGDNPYDLYQQKFGNNKQSERKLWNKSSNNKDLNLEYPDYYSEYKQTSTATSTESNKKYEEHLFHLHLNNQIMKLCSKKDKKTEEKEKLEGGFNVYVNGAHRKEKHIPRHTVIRNTTNRNKLSNFDPALLAHLNLNLVAAHNDDYPDNNAMTTRRKNTASSSTSNGGAATSRKKWVNSSIVIKTQDGLSVRIQGPLKSKSSSNSTGVTPRKSEEDPTSTQQSNNEELESNADEFYYSYDFVSDPDEVADEEEIIVDSISDLANKIKESLIVEDLEEEEVEVDDKSATLKDTSSLAKNLISEVKFSDVSDIDDDDDDDEYDEFDEENLREKSKKFIKKSKPKTKQESDDEEEKD